MSEHEAGRELDALVAERVMGEAVERGIGEYEHGFLEDDHILASSAFTWEGKTAGDPVPRYSTDISAAWDVVQKMAEGAGWQLYLTGPHGGWRAEFVWWGGRIPNLMETVTKRHYADTDTAPLAICLAALKAVED